MVFYIHCSSPPPPPRKAGVVFNCLKGIFAFLNKTENDLPIFSICQMAHGDLLSLLFNMNDAGTVHYAGIVAEATLERAKVYHFIVVP